MWVVIFAACRGFACNDVSFNENTASLYAHYRLGDIIKGLYPQSLETNTRYICTTWPKSLACAYRNATDNASDTRTLSRLLPPTLTSNRTIVHVRLGDGVGDAGCWEITCHGPRGKHPSGTVYAFSRHHYARIIHKLPKRPIVVVANPYHGGRDGISKSLVYLKLIMCFFHSHGFNVTYHGDGNSPDKDFTAMATADVFVKGGGGYSEFAAAVVKFRGHTVI
jgi:hypothetical protein